VDGKRTALSIALAFALACSPSAGTGVSTGSATPAVTPASTLGGTSSRPATAQPTASGTTTQAQLNEVLAAARLSPYKITYRYTVAGLVSEQSWYSKPPKQRFDFSTGGLVISYFTLPEGSYYCFAAGTTRQCMATVGVASPLEQNPAAVFVQAMIQNPGNFAGTFVEARTIAGQQGLCYDVNGTAAGVTSGRFCYTQTGILLYSAFGAAGTQIVMEATNVSTTVPDSDFDLPARP